ncbi:MAG: hypothetical protein ABI550_05395 [Ignavibacteriaceae bacterium]
MKIFWTFIFSALCCFNSLAQIELRAGMGINLLSNPTLTDYINQNYAASSNQLANFNTAVIFSLEGGYFVNKTFQMGIEAAYQINSYSYPDITGKYEFDYNIFMPSITSYYVFQGEGYNFKFGGGVGPRFSSVKETLPFTTASNSYSSTGFGFLLRADGNTALGNNVYANIGADFRYDWNGEPKNGSNKIMNSTANKNVDLNSLALGIKLGITYRF